MKFHLERNSVCNVEGKVTRNKKNANESRWPSHDCRTRLLFMTYNCKAWTLILQLRAYGQTAVPACNFTEVNGTNVKK